MNETNNTHDEDEEQNEEQNRQDIEEHKRSEPITEASYVYCPTCDKVHAGRCDFQ